MIVLFGAGGQLGQEVVGHARRIGAPLSAFDRRKADITDRNAVARAINRPGVELVINAAAYTKVDQAESEPDQAFAVNATGATVVAEACAEAGLPLIHISTDYVFDGNADYAYREDEPIAPLGVYGRSKAAGEDAVRQHNPNHVILRTAWVYGVYGKNFLKTVLRLAAEQDELRIVADQWGAPTSTEDLAAAIFRIRSKCAGAPWGTYHFTGAGKTTWQGFASRVVEAQARFTGRHPRVTAIATAEFASKAKRPVNSVLDTAHFAAVFGLSAAPWQQAVDRTVVKLLSGSRDDT